MKVILTIIITLTLSFQNLLFAQNEMQHSLSGQFGGGIGFLNFSNTHLAMNLYSSIDYGIGNKLIEIAFVKSYEFSPISKSVEYLSTFQIKYGSTYHFKMKGLFLPIIILPYLDIDKEFNYSLTGKVGISYNEGLFESKGYDSITDNNFGFGIPIELELREEITNYFGLGFIAYYNLNKVRNTGGLNTFIFIALN